MLPPLPELRFGFSDAENYDACKLVLEEEIKTVARLFLRLKGYVGAGKACVIWITNDPSASNRLITLHIASSEIGKGIADTSDLEARVERLFAYYKRFLEYFFFVQPEDFTMPVSLEEIAFYRAKESAILFTLGRL